MKKILTMLAFLLTMGGSINASTTAIPTEPNEIKIEVPANIKITENQGKDFQILIESDDSIITKLTKVKNTNSNSYIVGLDRPIEDSEIETFTAAGIKITIISPKPVRLVPGKNVEFKKSGNR